MPLEIFALITPLGIALIVLIVRYSGLSKTARLKDRNNAIEVFLGDYAGEEIGDVVILSRDRSAAFIEMSRMGKLGLVEVIADRFITRVLDAGTINVSEKIDDTMLLIRFNDFTHPKGHYEFSNQQDLSTVYRQLRNLEKRQ